MTALITLLFGGAALLSAAFGFMELRMLVRFLKHRAAIRASRNGGPSLGGHRNGARNGHANGAGEGHDGRLPTVTIQIPLYNERTSAEQIVRAAAAQDYPRDRFDIQVLDDSTDDTSRIVALVADEVRDGGVAIEHVHRRTRRGYKAGALAAGLERSRSEFVAVFDADFRPEEGFLTAILGEARPFRDPDVAFVQARWAWGVDERHGWLGSALSLLLDRHFRIQKPVRAHVGNVTTFNGSGGVWRRAAIDAAGGWTSDTLTEDLDLSYRCALAGWQGRYLHDVRVLNELPGHMRAFKLQQRRWSKGTAQCMRKLTGRIFGSGERLVDRWEELCLLAGYAIHPLLLVSLLTWPWAVLYTNRTLFWVLQGLMGIGVASAALSFVLTIRERDGALTWRGIREAVAGLCVGVGMMVNNTVGQLEGFLATGGEFVRTPKGGTTAANGRTPKGGASGANGAAGNGHAPASSPSVAYRTPLHWTFFGELAVIAYCLGGTALLVQRGEPLWSVAMVLWAVSLAVVAQQQLVDTSF